MALQPFKIHCPSCQTALKVTSSHLLGRTLPCPKCGAPIVISEPNRVIVRGPKDENVDSEAVTKVQDAAESSNPPVSSPTPATVKSQEDGKQRFHDNVPPDPWVLDLHPATESTPLHATEWVAESAQRSRQVLLVGLLALGGILVSTIAFIVFMNAIRKPDSNAISDAVAKPQRNEPSNLSTEITFGNATPPAEDKALNLEKSNEAKGANAANITTWQDILPADIPVVNSSDPLVAQEDPNAQSVPPLSANEASMPPEEQNPKGSELAASPVENPAPSNSGLGNFPRGLWDPSMNDLLSEAGSDVITNTPAKRIVDFGEMVHPPASPDINPDDWYSMRIVGLSADHRPATDILGALAQLTGVGIGLDLESFLAAGVPLDFPVSCDVSNMNIATFIETVFEPLNFGMRNLPNGLPILFVDPEVARAKVPSRMDLSEALHGREAKQLEALLKESLEDESMLMRLEGTELLIDDRASPIQRYRILALVARIGRALDCTIANDYPENAFQLGWDIGDAADRFRRPCSGLIDKPKPVPQLLRQAASQHDIHLLLDWPALWSHGMTPSTRGLSLLQHRTFEQILNRYLEEFSLDAAIIGPNTVVLTTPQSRRQFVQWKVVPIPLGKSTDDMELALADLAPVDVNQISRLLVKPIFDSGYAVVRVCLPTLRDIDELATWIR